MIKKPTFDDDNESNKRTNFQPPKVCVDYLSYLFEEMDLAASWRIMTKQKKDIMNGIRLENASWRTWAKQRNHLKTINPDTLNWLKDNDVTWLYGPLHTVTREKESDGTDKLRLDPVLNETYIMGTPLKSALKKITKSERLRRSDLSHICPTFRHAKLRFNQQVEQYRVISDDDNITMPIKDDDLRSIRRIEPTVLHNIPIGESSLWSWGTTLTQPHSNILLCSEKSQPISESFPIDAILHHQTSSHDRATCHDRILEQQQHHSSQSFLEILVHGFLTLGSHR